MNLPNQTPNELNKLLDDAAMEYKQNGRKHLYDKIKAIRECIKNLNLPVVFLENELQENIEVFLDKESNTTLVKIEDLIRKVAEIELKKTVTVIEGNYGKAARLREEYNKIPNLILDLVVQHNAFSTGFNVFKGKLLIVSHNDAAKAQIIEMLHF